MSSIRYFLAGTSSSQLILYSEANSNAKFPYFFQDGEVRIRAEERTNVPDGFSLLSVREGLMGIVSSYTACLHRNSRSHALHGGLVESPISDGLRPTRLQKKNSCFPLPSFPSISTNWPIGLWKNSCYNVFTSWDRVITRLCSLTLCQKFDTTFLSWPDGSVCTSFCLEHLSSLRYPSLHHRSDQKVAWSPRNLSIALQWCIVTFWNPSLSLSNSYHKWRDKGLVNKWRRFAPQTTMKIPQLALKKLLGDGDGSSAAVTPAGSRRGSRRPSLVVTAPGQPGSRRDSIIMDLAVSLKSRAGSTPTAGNRESCCRLDWLQWHS